LTIHFELMMPYQAAVQVKSSDANISINFMM